MRYVVYFLTAIWDWQAIICRQPVCDCIRKTFNTPPVTSINQSTAVDCTNIASILDMDYVGQGFANSGWSVSYKHMCSCGYIVLCHQMLKLSYAMYIEGNSCTSVLTDGMVGYKHKYSYGDINLYHQHHISIPILNLSTNFHDNFFFHFCSN